MTEADVDRWAQSAAILHSNGDALDIAVKDNRIVGVRGRAADRVNHGLLVPKDLFGWQANHSADGLTRPLVCRHGELVETDLDTAMEAVAGRTRELLEKRGRARSASTRRGSCFSRSTTPSPCSVTAVSAPTTWTATRDCVRPRRPRPSRSRSPRRGQPGSYTDIDHDDVIALYGHNMAETQTVLWSRILDRLAGPAPPKVISVDPRETPVARDATATSRRGPVRT